MTWIWADVPDETDSFYVEYLHGPDSLSSHLLMGPNLLPSDAGRAILNGRRYSAKRVLKYGIVNAASRERVVHDRLRNLISKFIPDESGIVQFYPFEIITRDGTLHEHFALIPLNEVLCTDVDRSDITTWMIPKSCAIGYRSLVHLPNCLGNLPIARDSVTGNVVISDDFKTFLEMTKESGLYFVKPEAMRTYIL
jgi:hypothetical protein